MEWAVKTGASSECSTTPMQCERVHTDVDSDGVLDSDQKGHLDAEHPTNPISPKRIKNATKRAKSAMASERAKPKMAYPKSCFESDGLRDTE